MRSVYKTLFYYFLIYNSFLFGASISGVVQNSNSGSPVQGALVWALTNDSTSSDSMFYEAYTDEQGQYILNDIVKGSYHISVTHPDFYRATETLDVANGDIAYNLNFKLIQIQNQFDNKISGIVYDKVTNETIAGAEIILRPFGIFSHQYYAVSNEKGQYYFKNIVPSPHIILAYKPGYASFISDTFKVDENTVIDDLDLYLKPINNDSLGVLFGYVSTLYDSISPTDTLNTRPVYPALISLFNNNISPDPVGDSLYYSTWNNPDGSYKIDNIIPGNYQVKVSARGYESEEINGFQIQTGRNKKDFLLKQVNFKYGSITGKVTFDDLNEPVSYAFMEFIGVDQDRQWYNTFTDSAGLYAIKLPVGRYVVSCSYHGLSWIDSLWFGPVPPYSYQEYYDDVHTFSEATIIPVEYNTEVKGIDFSIPKLSDIKEIHISGNVKDYFKQPVEGAKIKVWINNYYPPVDSIGPSIYDSLFTTYSKEDGSWSLQFKYPNIIFSSIVVSVQKRGYDIQFYDHKPEFYLADRIYIRPEIENINFDLKPIDTHDPVSISGSVENQYGNPVSNAFVLAGNVSLGTLYFALTGNDGRYNFDGIPAGVYYVVFAADGYIPEFYNNAHTWEDADAIIAYQDVDNINAELASLHPCGGNGIILGQVSDNLGSPLPGALVTVKNSNNLVVAYSFTDEKGNFQMGGMNSDEFTIEAGKIAYTSAQKTVKQDADFATNVVNLSLNKAVTAIKNRENNFVPDKIYLSKSYPNPFNPSTSVEFGLPSASKVKISVFNILGQEIKVLVNGTVSAGQHSIVWNATDENGKKVSSGLYFLKLQAGETSLLQKMILAK